MNQIPTPMRVEGVNYRELMKLMFKKDKSRIGRWENRRNRVESGRSFGKSGRSQGSSPTAGALMEGGAQDGALMWLGHSTILLNINGTTILTDPVFSKRASPFSFMGPKAFEGSTPYQVEDLPDPDIILISHDHYDHLDYKTIRKIHRRTKRFIVPLGVAAHLIHWGVDPGKISELDWWEQITVARNDAMETDPGITLTCTPQRHFSGRGMRNRNTTLWCSWAIESGDIKVFWGADGGYSPVFKEVGEKFGGFDLALLECGAYSKFWPNIHSMPEETVQAAVDLRAKFMIPIHWGKFNLSIHPWREPVERLQAEAGRKGVQVEVLAIGEEMAIGETRDARNEE